MTSHRTILMTLISLLAVSVAMTSSALAGPLLGGYGGPGEGNQAILGSTLVGNSGRGGGSSGGATGGSPGSSPSGLAGSGGQSGHSNGAPTGSSGRGSSGGRRGQTSGGVARAYPVLSRQSALQPASGGSAEKLGVSGEDVAYIFLALGGLAFTGALTRWLARTSRPEGL
jgi:hypothetical protein